MQLRDSIKCNLEHDLSIEHDRGIIFMLDADIVCVEYDGGDAPVMQEHFGVEDIEVAIDVFIAYIQEEYHSYAKVNWPKEGF